MKYLVSNETSSKINTPSQRRRPYDDGSEGFDAASAPTAFHRGKFALSLNDESDGPFGEVSHDHKL